MAAITPDSLTLSTDAARRLRTHVDYLASPALEGRRPGTPGNRRAADYVEQRFRDAGLQSLPSLRGFRQTLPGGLGDNVLAFRPASRPGPGGTTPAWLLVGAHFDHLGGSYLGADDNASAVAILIELARTLLALEHHHVVFAGFNAEEPPYIRTPEMGSQFFVDHLPIEIGSPDRFQAVIIMDILGGVHWEPLTDVVFACGAEQSPGLYRRVKDAAAAAKREPADRGSRAGTLASIAKSTLGSTTPRRDEKASPSSALGTRHLPFDLPQGDPEHVEGSGSGQPRPSALTVVPLGMHLVEEIPLVGPVSFSDYDAFRNRRVPFVFLSSGRTPRYHQPTDLPDTLHYARMAATVGWLTDLLTRIDGDSAPYGFKAGRIELADELVGLRPLAELAADRDTMIPGSSTLSLWRLKRDVAWLAQLDPRAATLEDVRRLEHLSLRLQCLLADFSGCFLF